MKKIIFQNSKAQELVGDLFLPKENAPIVIFVHGYPSDKNSSKAKALSKTLLSKGIGLFVIDLSGRGESEGKFEEITITEAIDEVKRGIQFIKDLGYQRIGLVGSSFGGLASIVAASKTDDLFVLVLKSPVSDYLSKIISIKDKEINTWRERGYADIPRSNGSDIRLSFSFFEDAQKVSGYEVAEEIKIPTLIVHGDEDMAVSIEQSRKVAELIPNCKLEEIKGTDHSYTRVKDFEKMLELISSFIIEHSF